MKDDPNIVDVDFEPVDPPRQRDRRPFWQRYRIVIDWRAGLIAAIIGGLTALRIALGGH